MADIRSYPFVRHLRSNPTSCIVHAKKGTVRHRGPGAAFYVRALDAAISEVPTAEAELSMLFGARTKDFQEAAVQATVTYRFADPEVAAARIDFAIDPYSGQWIGKPPGSAVAVIEEVHRGRATVERRAMVQATLDDGQTLVALNDVYLGDPGHQSSRHTLTVPDRGSERQSSSGIIVGTGTGATGWSSSIAADRDLGDRLPEPGSDILAWFVREAWPSRATGRELAFGDGIEHDRLPIGWGQRFTVGASAHRLALVT